MPERQTRTNTHEEHRRAALPTGTVTFLFTDIEGSTRLLQRVGPDFPRLLDTHVRLINKAVRAHDGVVVNTEGDGLFIAFARAPNGVAAAVDAQRALFAESWPVGTTVKVRMGLHTGEGALGGSDYVGIDVHRAARVGAAAHGGQILVSSATRSLTSEGAPNGTSFRDLGEHRLEGLDRPERLFQVLAPDLPAEFPPPRTIGARPNNLPVQATAFVGRSRELNEVVELFEESRLVTLTGPGGVGKTRLALQVGTESLDRFPDGVFVARLESIEDPDLIITTIARSIGIVEGGDRPVAEVLRDYLTSRRLLLILDNCEHLHEGMPQVADLLAEAGGFAVLATSRSPLRLRGEQVYPVPPLETPEPGDDITPADIENYAAIDLFVRRASEADPMFSLNERNAPSVARIVRSLDGIPLALELAAARLKLLTPAELVARLSDRLSLLTSGPADAPDRHRTLRAAIEWSHDQLRSDEQVLFRRLGVLSGSFGFDAAKAIGAGPPVKDVLGGVSSLVDQSLLRRRIELEEEARFQMLESIRAYARDRLVQSGEEREVIESHSAYFLSRAERAGRELTGDRQGLWLERLELDHDDFRSLLSRLLDSGNVDEGLHTAGHLWRFWQFKGHLEEGRSWLEQFLALPGATPGARATGLLALAGLAYWQGDMDTAEPAYRDAIPVGREAGHTDGVAEALASLAIMSLFRRDMDAADRLLEKAEAELPRVEDPRVKVATAAGRGMSFLLRDDAESALSIFTDLVALSRRRGDTWLLGQGLVLRVRAELALERYETAEQTAREAMELSLQAGELSTLAQAFDWLGLVAVRKGEVERGVQLAGAASAVRDRMGIGLTLPVRGLPGPRESAREHLSDDEIRRAWERGKAMSRDEALAFARREPSTEGPMT